jgi:hypothetical protein
VEGALCCCDVHLSLTAIIAEVRLTKVRGLSGCRNRYGAVL